MSEQKIISMPEDYDISFAEDLTQNNTDNLPPEEPLSTELTEEQVEIMGLDTPQEATVSMAHILLGEENASSSIYGDVNHDQNTNAASPETPGIPASINPNENIVFDTEAQMDNTIDLLGGNSTGTNPSEIIEDVPLPPPSEEA